MRGVLVVTMMNEEDALLEKHLAGYRASSDTVTVTGSRALPVKHLAGYRASSDTVTAGPI